MASVQIQQQLQASETGFNNSCFGNLSKRSHGYEITCGVGAAALDDDLSAPVFQNSTSAPLVDSTRNFGAIGGDGEDSYSKNSSAQRQGVQTVMPLLIEAVDRVALPINSPSAQSAGGPLLIADLGCASGPNCLQNADDIVCRLKARHVAQGLRVPSFQVFFQDLPSTDFNNLFRLICKDNSFHDNDRVVDGRVLPSSKYFVAGVPGTVYGRLFPDSSIHVIFSSYCLHWLSKVPDPILIKENPAYNKARSWVHRASQAVATAYADQAARDLKVFLTARAAEVVPGGLVLLLFVGRRHPDPTRVLDNESGLFALLWELVDDVFNDMTAEGVVSEELRDSFNCATYFRSVEEVRDVVQSYSSDWEVLRVEPHPIYHFQEYLARFGIKQGESPHSFARRVLLMYKVTRAPQITAHIGPELAKLFWDRYEQLYFGRTGLVEELYSRIGRPSIPATQILVSLIRK